MFDDLITWSWQAWLAIAQLAALLFWRPLLKLRDWALQSGHRQERLATAEMTRLLDQLVRQNARITDLEDLIDLLRKALDKHLIREGAVASAAELLIVILEQVERPTDAMLRIKDRALEILEQARAQLRQINQGGRE